MALEKFLSGNSDFALILEDDALIEKNSFRALEKLINESDFDYYDIAGGDGIEVNDKSLIEFNEIYGEANRYQSTRTACAYITSRNSASAIVDELNEMIMPIDWAISVALKKIRPKAKVFG